MEIKASFDRSLPEKRLTVAQFQTQEVDVPTANVDFSLVHTMNVPPGHPVRYAVLDANVGGVVYRGSRMETAQLIWLRATIAGHYRIRLFVEPHVNAVNPIPLS